MGYFYPIVVEVGRLPFVDQAAVAVVVVAGVVVECYLQNLFAVKHFVCFLKDIL